MHTAKLICVFVFAYAKCWFSHEAAHLFDFPNVYSRCLFSMFIPDVYSRYLLPMFIPYIYSQCLLQIQSNLS